MYKELLVEIFFHTVFAFVYIFFLMNGAYNFNLYIKVFKLLVLFALAPVVCEVLVAQYIVFCVEFCLLSFEHCIVSPSSAFSFWLPFSIFKLFYSTKME
jgi:hypothetical protein